jgi:glycosyltransferase involved in cell wall biosynthesis
MDTKLLLSFIVPFYNVEEYIEECIRSLYNQDIPFSDYEVIAVNDCTKDRSRDIVLDLIKEFPTLQLIDHEVNRKLGGARNTGLTHSKGEYVWFIDSDDFIKPNCLSHLLKTAINNKLQILHFDYVYVTPNRIIEEVYTTNYTTEILTGKTFIHDSEDLWWKKCIEVWRKLHKREFLIKNRFLFEENVFYEDFIYSLKMLYKTDRIMHVPETPYCYRINPDSFTNSKNTGNKLSESFRLSIRCIDLCNFLKVADLNFLQTLMSFTKLQLNIVKKELMYLSHTERKNYFEKIKNEKVNEIKPLLRKFDYYLITKSFLSKILFLFYKPYFLIKKRFKVE